MKKKQDPNQYIDESVLRGVEEMAKKAKDMLREIIVKVDELQEKYFSYPKSDPLMATLHHELRALSTKIKSFLDEN